MTRTASSLHTPETMDAYASIDRYRFFAAALHLLPTLVWAILALSYWRSRGTARPQSHLLRLFRALCGILAVHYGLNVVLDLTHPGTGEPGALWTAGCVLTKATTLAELAVLRHLVPLATLGAAPPGRLWLAVNYGGALLAGLVTAGLGTFPQFASTVVHVYLLAMTAAIVWDVLRLARSRRGRWRPLIMADLGATGFAALGGALFVAVVAIVLLEQARPGPDLMWATVHSGVGVALAAVFALRVLGEVVRRLLVTLASLAAAAAIYLGTRAAAGLADPGMSRVAEVAGLLALVLVLGPGAGWLRNAVDHLMLHQCRCWDGRLHTFLQTLSPELGVAGCRRRAVAEVVETLSLRGAGTLAEDSATGATKLAVVTRGRLDLEPVARVWPRGAAARRLPDRAFDLLWLDDLELQEALHDAGVTWVVPVTSPRKRWGHLFVSAGTFGLGAGGARLETLETFARQLALVLDSADLLGRAVAVERELAQAGKLAAVGEMAARMAHEIRNPVTAARSLAQTLSREPDSPLNAEHTGLIVRELDRVEHQVRTLLEFARRETYRFEPVGLAELVRATVGDLEPRLSGGGEGLDVELDLDSDVVVRADPERLRQVLINLVENAVDALREAPGAGRPAVSVADDGDARRETSGTGRLTVSVAAEGNRATLSVRDTGPGVAEADLPRIFDPFFSQKTQGTGLGLAIARRIVEAHGGRIEAEPGATRGRQARGMVFRVALPVERAPGAAGLERAV